MSQSLTASGNIVVGTAAKAKQCPRKGNTKRCAKTHQIGPIRANRPRRQIKIGKYYAGNTYVLQIFVPHFEQGLATAREFQLMVHKVVASIGGKKMHYLAKQAG
jgi:hypothetical protein